MSDPQRGANHQEAMVKLREVEPPRILSNRVRDAFLALLDANHEPNEALKAAATEYRKGWREGKVYHFQPTAHDPKSRRCATLTWKPYAPADVPAGAF